MKPSMWSSFLYEMYPLEAARTLSRHGWSHSELSDEHGHDLLNMGKPAEIGRAFQKIAADYGISFPQGHFYLLDNSWRQEYGHKPKAADIAPADDQDYARAMEDMKRWVELFDAVGVKAGVLHCGGHAMLRDGVSQAAVFERRCQAVAAVADFAAGSCVTICLENLSSVGTRTCEELLTLIKAVNRPNVAICLDTGHAHLNAVDVPDFIRQADSYLQALHIADNLGQRDDHMLPCGRGTVPWPKVMAALREINYQGLFNLEVPGERSIGTVKMRLAKLDYALKLANEMINDQNW